MIVPLQCELKSAKFVQTKLCPNLMLDNHTARASHDQHKLVEGNWIRCEHNMDMEQRTCETGMSVVAGSLSIVFFFLFFFKGSQSGNPPLQWHAV